MSRLLVVVKIVEYEIPELELELYTSLHTSACNDSGTNLPTANILHGNKSCAFNRESLFQNNALTPIVMPE